MLSVTNTVLDVKVKLGPFGNYGFDDDLLYTAAIEISADDVQYLKMISFIGGALYEEIQAKDKVDLEENEAYIYKAEVYAIAVSFLKDQEILSQSAGESSASSEKLTIEGYTYEVANSTGTVSSNSLATQVRLLNPKYVMYMMQAGYNVHQLVRGGSVFG